MVERLVGSHLEEDEGIAVSDNSKQGRERSKIAFPYGALEDAIDVARAVSPRGDSCLLKQLAPWMGHDSVTSGTFRVKLSTARIFGVIDVTDGTATLTTTGKQIVDPSYERNARVQAFLHVPLYRKLFDQYNGALLPKDIGIENEIVRLGVPVKQKGKARQAFQRSAEQAGFFEIGKDRLVLPAGAPPVASPPPASAPLSRELPESGRDAGGTGGGIVPPQVPPAIRGMLSLLPAEGAKWTSAQRDRWIGALTAILDFLYKADEPNQGSPRVPAWNTTENRKTEQNQ